MKLRMPNNIVFLLILLCSWVSAQENIRIMSFNVRYDESFYDAANTSMDNWPNRREFQVALLNFHRPEVIGMQEPLGHQVQYFAENLSDYKWIGVGREDGENEGEYNPIFYKADKIEALSSGTFWLSQNPDKVSKSWDAGYTRICTWALFQFKESESKFYFFNTHFDSKGENARLESAKLINEKINDLDSDIPVIVTGDFNFTEDSEVYTEITSNGLSDSKKASIEEPYGPEGTFNGFKFNQAPKQRIDYIFVNQNVKVQRYGVLTDSYNQRYPSDHLPVNIFVSFPR